MSRYCLILALAASALNAGAAQPVVRIAELQIDSAYIEPYKAALRHEIETSIRLEPGVLTLYATSIKDHPTQVRIFEIYADNAAYDAHLHAPHFLKYKAETQSMIQSLTLLETDPIALASKPR